MGRLGPMVLIESKKLLIVDDSPANLKLLRLLLGAEGHSVQTADNASQALDLLSSFTPDAILMDIQMADLNGLQLTRRIKADPLTRDIMVLAVSANAMKVDIEEAYAAGCEGYITKPIDTRTFVSTVGEYLLRVKAPLENTGKSLMAACSDQIDRLLEEVPPARREDVSEILQRCAGVARTSGHPGITSVSPTLETILTDDELRAELLKLRQRLAEFSEQPTGV